MRRRALPRRAVLALALGALAAPGCAARGERTVFDAPPPRPPTAADEVGRMVGELLAGDERASLEAERGLTTLDPAGRRALEAHARAIPTERDPRWLNVLEENGLLRAATAEQRLDLLVWKARRADADSAREGAEALLAWARRDPAPLAARLARPGEGRDVVATALGGAGAKTSVPALLALYRTTQVPEERRAASSALGAIAGDALRPRVDGTTEEIEADAARIEAWAGRVRDERAP